MDTIDRNEHRLTELEIKASFTEDLIEQLNQVQRLRQQWSDATTVGNHPPRDERPPHY